MTTTRRDLIAALAAVAALPAGRLAAAARPAAAGQRFSWEGLVAQAAALAKRPYAKRAPAAAGIAAVDYDALNSIKFKAAATQLRGASGGGVRFFPVNRMQPLPVEIFVVDGDVARPFAYHPGLFEMPADSPLAKLGDDAGFSGFRAMNESGESDWAAFAGASYFRTAGALDQYGLSARGIAVDSGGPGPEEFPDFTKFWLGRDRDGTLLVDALLDGPSVTGAFRFANRHGKDGVVQEIEVALFLRKDIARLGLAPLTSMFWYDQADRRMATDWRPEIHDSDGLLILNGKGERIWRALNNAPHAIVNSFADTGPKGFGLLQRDRDFDHYQDDGVFYDKRPSAWVEPIGDWGPGAVSLLELPTSDETNDNIVAFWTPAKPAKAGDRYRYKYRLRWIAGEPLPAGPARVVDFWKGQGGRPGRPAIKGTTKLTVDFRGAGLAGLDRQSGVVADVTVTRGRLEDAAAYPVVGGRDRWRLMADVTPAGGEPTDVRAVLRRGGKEISEVFVAQLVPA